MEGLGKTVPPLENHVIIYFLQKNSSEYEALEFYRYFDTKQWANNRGEKLSNWKMAAWEWVLKRNILKGDII